MDIYDKLLGGIGVSIILMLAGFLVGPSLGIGAGFIALALVGSAMFIYTPTDIGRPKDLSTRSAYVDTQSDERDHSINT